MDASQALIAALGVVVVLAGFWAFIGTQFVRRDVLAEQHKNFNDKLDQISSDISQLSQTTIIKNTVNEVFDRLTEAFPDSRLSARGKNN